jgi:hypothetical protein
MREDETATLLVWINQFDAFVQMNDAAAKIWHGSMYQITYAEAEEAVIQHYRANPGKQAEPGAIMKRALTIRATEAAKRQAKAITGPPAPEKTMDQYESRVKSPQFRALFDEGVRQREAMVARLEAQRAAHSG